MTQVSYLHPEHLARQRVQFQVGLSKPLAHLPQTVKLFWECATNDKGGIQVC